MKRVLQNYMEALDLYRSDPNRTNKDLLFEAECEARALLGMNTDHLEQLYYFTK